MFQFLKLLPTLLKVIDAIKDILEAVKKRKELEDKELDTSKQEGIIKENTSRLAEIGHKFLPDKYKKRADLEEVKIFFDSLQKAAEAIVNAVESFMPLLK